MTPARALWAASAAGLLSAAAPAIPMRLDPAAISQSVEDRRPTACPPVAGADAIADLLHQLEETTP
jgi:hypothetical protein